MSICIPEATGPSETSRFECSTNQPLSEDKVYNFFVIPLSNKTYHMIQSANKNYAMPMLSRLKRQLTYLRLMTEVTVFICCLLVKAAKKQVKYLCVIAIPFIV